MAKKAKKANPFAKKKDGDKEMKDEKTKGKKKGFVKGKKGVNPFAKKK